MADVYEQSLQLHKENRGKMEIRSKVPVTNKDELSLAYTPGVAQPCREIAKDKSQSFVYTNRGNTVAVITDGSAVLGLGNIGPEAALPVMEGKSILFKEFAGVDAFPICLNTQDPKEIINICKMLEPSLGGINLEDISFPRCIEIERTLKQEMSIPVFHDDQHGTAIVVLAGVMNAIKLTGKKKEEMKAVISGAGAAGSSIIRILHAYGIGEIYAFDINGCVKPQDRDKYDPFKAELLEFVNTKGIEYNNMAEAMVGADLFVGVSAPNLVTEEMVRSMNKDAILFAMANPSPEIMPDIAKKAGARIVGTGRSDFPNQINNVLVFPGIFRGALDAGAKGITEEMKMAASAAIASLVTDEELNDDYIIPPVFDKRVSAVVAEAVKKCAYEQGITR